MTEKAKKKTAKVTKKAAPESTKLTRFQFVDAGRTFSCAIETRGNAPDGWWWFSIGTDAQGQRYAPFRAEESDTQESVQKRIVAYYDDMLARRAAPPTSNHWGRRPGAAAANGAAAAAAATAAANGAAANGAAATEAAAVPATAGVGDESESA